MDSSSPPAIAHPEAYERAVAPYRAGPTADRLVAFLLRRLRKVKWGSRGAKRRWRYTYAGLHGIVLPSNHTDTKGCVGFAFFARDSIDGPFKRKKLPWAPKPDAWLPLPEVYAHLNGVMQRPLDPAELRRWSRKLLVAAGAEEEWQAGAGPSLSNSFSFQELPDPDEPFDSETYSVDPWLRDFSVKHGDKVRRLPRRQERLIYAIYSAMCERWEEQRWPLRVFRASDGYLARAMDRLGFHADRYRIRCAVLKLEQAAYITAVQVVGAQNDEQGRRVKVGHYSYLPGDGAAHFYKVADYLALGRSQHLPAHAPLTALRRLTDCWGLGPWLRLLAQAVDREEREEVRAAFLDYLRRKS
jgi:hypothetical protein